MWWSIVTEASLCVVTLFGRSNTQTHPGGYNWKNTVFPHPTKHSFFFFNPGTHRVMMTFPFIASETECLLIPEVLGSIFIGNLDISFPLFTDKASNSF